MTTITSSSHTTVVLPTHVYALAMPKFEQHVMDQGTFSHWRSAMVSWLLANGYTAADSLLPHTFVRGMDNPLAAYTEHRLVIPNAVPARASDLNALFEAIHAVEAEHVPAKPPAWSTDKTPDEPSFAISTRRKRAREPSSDSDSDSDDGSDDDRLFSSSASMSDIVAYSPAKQRSPAKRARVTPPVSEGITPATLAFLMEGKHAETVFGGNYCVLDAVMNMGKLIEGLRMVRAHKASYHTWSMMRVVSVDYVTRTVTCDVSVFDAHLAPADHVLVTYGMDSYALRPIVFNNDTKQGALCRWPEHHYCEHTSQTGAVKTPAVTSSAHTKCLRLVEHDRAIQGTDVVFAQVLARAHRPRTPAV